MTALRQKLPLAGSKSNFRFIPESRLNSEIAACPKSAINGRGQPSFDHFVSEREQRRRYFEAKRLGGFEINTKPERDRLLHWNFAWSFPFQYLIDDSRRASENICMVGAVGDEGTRRNCVQVGAHHRQTILQSQSRQALARIEDHRIRDRRDAFETLSNRVNDSLLDLDRAAHLKTGGFDS